MSQEIDAAAPATGIPAGPSLPAPPPRPPSAPASTTLPSQFSRLTAVESTPSPSRYTKKKKSALGRLLKLTIVATLIGGVGLVGYRLVHEQTIAFPTFNEPPPSYQSVTLKLDEYDDKQQHEAFTVSTNGDASVIAMSVDDGEMKSKLTNLITDGTTVFVHRADGTWVYAKYGDDETAVDVLAGASHLYTFNGVVTDSARPYTSIVSKAEDEIDGRKLTKYELLIRTQDFRSENREEYKKWAADIAAPAETPHLGRLVLWVDEHGIVWRLSSYADGEEDTADSVTLVEFSNTPFVPDYPIDFTDLVDAPAP